jgi:hypothetical protein
MKTLILLLLLSTPIFAQIQVSQGFIDDATRSFIEVRALRELDTARKSEIEAKNALITSQTSLIEALKQGQAVRDEQIKALSKLKCDKISIFWVIKKTTCR